MIKYEFPVMVVGGTKGCSFMDTIFKISEANWFPHIDMLIIIMNHVVRTEIITVVLVFNIFLN